MINRIVKLYECDKIKKKIYPIIICFGSVPLDNYILSKFIYEFKMYIVDKQETNQ